MSKQRPRRYRAFCDASPDAIILVNQAGRITYANARVSDLFEYDPEEVIGEQLELLVPESKREAHVPKRDGYLRDPETRPMGAADDLEARRKDGSTFPVDISLSPINVDGEVRAMAAVRDTSEREALRRKYRTILEAVPDAVVVADPASGKIVETNDQVEDLFGYRSDELVGEPQTKLHPSGEEDRYRTLFEEHVDTGKAIFTALPHGSDIYIETREGDRVPVEINASLFDLGDRRLIAGVFRDISTRHEYERQLEELHSTSREFFQAETPEEIADLVARTTRATLGFERNVVRLAGEGEELHPVAVTDQARSNPGALRSYPVSGDNPASRAFESGDPIVVEDLREVEGGSDLDGSDLDGSDFDGSDLDGSDLDGSDFGGSDRETPGSAMYLPLGDYGILSILDPEVGAFEQSDVDLASILTSNARTALARLEAQRELERQVERLDKFAGIVSHDLRNPMNVAQSWLDIARDEADREELQRVSDALDRMESVVNDTLTLARAGETIGEKEPIELGRLVGQCWSYVSTAGRSIEIERDCTIYGDRNRLQHLLENLFRNAVEHGGNDVTVKVGVTDDGGFYVEDDGAGIPDDERDLVFEPGYSTTSVGSGFGLSIVEETADAHGWNVDVVEGSDGGARFEFTGVECVTE